MPNVNRSSPPRTRRSARPRGRPVSKDLPEAEPDAGPPRQRPRPDRLGRCRPAGLNATAGREPPMDQSSGHTPRTRRSSSWPGRGPLPRSRVEHQGAAAPHVAPGEHVEALGGEDPRRGLVHVVEEHPLHASEQQARASSALSLGVVVSGNRAAAGLTLTSGSSDRRAWILEKCVVADA